MTRKIIKITTYAFIVYFSAHLINVASYVPALLSAKVVSDEVEYASAFPYYIVGLMISTILTSFLIVWVAKKLQKQGVSLVISYATTIVLFLAASFFESVFMNSVSSLYLTGESYSRSFNAFVPHFAVPAFSFMMFVFMWKNQK